MTALNLFKRPSTLGMSSIIGFAVVILLVVFSMVGYAWQNKTVAVLVDGQTRQVKTFKNTVGDLLKEAQINLAQEDVVNPGVTTPLEEGMKISIEKAKVVKILVDGKVLDIKTPQISIAEVLKREGIQLGKLDKVSPVLTETISAGSEIKVTRVAEKTEQIKAEIPYAVERKKDNKITKGIKKLIQEGQAGTRQKIIKITFEDGKAVKKQVVSEQILKKPVPQIVAIGTLSVVSRGGHTFKTSRSLVASSTAYTHTGNRTATGRHPSRGIAAVDPDVIPLGSRLYVEGYGEAIAADTGGAIQGNKIDLFFETEQEARDWGRRRVTVYIKE